MMVIFTFMLRCWMFGALWVGLSPPSLYSHISTQHQGMGEHNSTSPATARNSRPSTGPSRLRKHFGRCHSNKLENTRIPHVLLTLSKEVLHHIEWLNHQSYYYVLKFISFLCSCLNGSLGRIWNTVIIIKYEFLFRITIILNKWVLVLWALLLFSPWCRNCWASLISRSGHWHLQAEGGGRGKTGGDQAKGYWFTAASDLDFPLTNPVQY